MISVYMIHPPAVQVFIKFQLCRSVMKIFIWLQKDRKTESWKDRMMEGRTGQIQYSPLPCLNVTHLLGKCFI